MFGDTEIQPNVVPSEPSSFPSQPITPPAYTPPLPPTPPSPVQTYIPKPKPSILPLLFGFLIVIIAAAAIGVVYYKNKLTTTPSPTPATSAKTDGGSVEPSVEPSEIATSSGSPRASGRASATPKPSVKPTLKPSATPTPSPTPTPTPVPQISLDIRFGNPSANIKQTIDEGAGDGRVINREYTSIQTGLFDEVKSVWAPKVTVCYQMVSNEDIAGKDVKMIFSLDDKAEDEYNLGQYDKLEAGRLYDWCHDVTTSIGKHTARLQINSSKSLKESNYVNNFARIDWENLADKIPPNFTLTGPFDWTTKGTCFLILPPSDNVTSIPNLKVEQKIDSGAYATTSLTEYCFKGTTGDPHSYSVKITDERGNANEQLKTFVLY